MGVKSKIMENSKTTLKLKESNLIKLVLMVELWTLADVDLVRPPSSKRARSSLIFSSPDSTRLLSAWLQIETPTLGSANIEVNKSNEYKPLSNLYSHFNS